MGQEQSATTTLEQALPVIEEEKQETQEKQEEGLIVEEEQDDDDDDDDKEFIADIHGIIDSLPEDVADGDVLDALHAADVRNVEPDVCEFGKGDNEQGSILDDLISMDGSAAMMLSAGEATDVMMQQWIGSGADELAMQEEFLEQTQHMTPAGRETIEDLV